MMTRNKKARSTEVETQTTTLTPLEEKVVRMRHGLRAPDELLLDQVGQDDSLVAEQLRAIEDRALSAVSARMNPTKRKIVSGLRRKHD